ncbi:porin [Sphingomonas japonica]|uniref:Porin n=1 Tax=Sphingomonas japonica TaxID=511662 RepID=A0ABX0TYV0_9SPHN|nr:porin [Sphingomonas japonica]NIJ23498.1 hypothetical protein [Sphingomonas japonica]
MAKGRIIAGLGFGALLAAGTVVAPMLHAQESGAQRLLKRSPSISRSGIGSFTPASGDPRLAAVLARAGLSGNSGFRFTPSERKSDGRKSVTVAVRARSSRSASAAERISAPAANNVSIAPIAYNLGVSVGWKRFALSGDMARVDLGALPGSREVADLGVSYTGKRASARVKAGVDRPTEGQPALVAEGPAYSLDVGGSYSLSRNLDVTAGVRYKSEEDRARLPRLTQQGQQRDSQAVYIGTAFRF